MNYLVIGTYQGDLSEQMYCTFGLVKDYDERSVINCMKNANPGLRPELTKSEIDKDLEFGLCKPLVCYRDNSEWHPHWVYVIELH